MKSLSLDTMQKPCKFLVYNRSSEKASMIRAQSRCVLARSEMELLDGQEGVCDECFLPAAKIRERPVSIGPLDRCRTHSAICVEEEVHVFRTDVFSESDQVRPNDSPRMLLALALFLSENAVNRNK